MKKITLSIVIALTTAISFSQTYQLNKTHTAKEVKLLMRSFDGIKFQYQVLPEDTLGIVNAQLPDYYDIELVKANIKNYLTKHSDDLNIYEDWTKLDNGDYQIKLWLSEKGWFDFGNITLTFKPESKKIYLTFLIAEK